MESTQIDRRTVLKGAAAATTGLAVVEVAGPPAAFAGEVDGGEVIPWSDQPPPIPPPAQGVFAHPLHWESLDSFDTQRRVFTVKHYGDVRLSGLAYRLSLEGLVARPQQLSLAALKALPHRTVDFTLECSGTTGSPSSSERSATPAGAGTPLTASSAGPGRRGTTSRSSSGVQTRARSRSATTRE